MNATWDNYVWACLWYTACLYTAHRLLFALIESYLGNLLPTKTIALSEVLGTISYPLPAK